MPAAAQQADVDLGQTEAALLGAQQQVAGGREREEEDRRLSDEDDEEIVEAFEKVKLRVTFPRTKQFRNDLVLESWMEWDQVYGSDEEDEEEGGTAR